jgi:hypothetical protein
MAWEVINLEVLRVVIPPLIVIEPQTILATLVGTYNLTQESLAVKYAKFPRPDEPPPR